MIDLLRLVLCLLPASRLKNFLLSRTPGWSLHATACLGPNLVWGIGTLELGPSARIGPFNAFRQLRAVRLEANADIGQFNWFSGAARFIPDAKDPALAGVLLLHDSASITSRHYFDLSGGFEMHPFSVMAGVRSTVLTHSIDVRTGLHRTAPVRIGRQSVIFTNAVMTPGAEVGEQIAVSALSVVQGRLRKADGVYSGSPARLVTTMPGAELFRRTETRVLSREEEQRLMRETKAAERSA